MPPKILRQEILMLGRRALWLDLAAYLISVIFCGVTVSFAAGLLLGTAVLLGTLMILSYSIMRMAEDAKRTGVTSQRRYLLFYGLRLLLFAAAFGVSLCLRAYISPAAVVIPMLYPRLIYTAGAVFPRSGSGKSSDKKR